MFWQGPAATVTRHRVSKMYTVYFNHTNRVMILPTNPSFSMLLIPVEHSSKYLFTIASAKWLKLNLDLLRVYFAESTFVKIGCEISTLESMKQERRWGMMRMLPTWGWEWRWCWQTPCLPCHNHHHSRLPHRPHRRHPFWSKSVRGSAPPDPVSVVELAALSWVNRWKQLLSKLSVMLSPHNSIVSHFKTTIDEWLPLSIVWMHLLLLLLYKKLANCHSKCWNINVEVYCSLYI